MQREPLVSVTADNCRWDYFRGTGPGGQKRNKTSNCARCTHEPSGAVGEARESRSQRENREVAFGRMARSQRFQTWLRLECARRTGVAAQIEEEVERQARNVRVDVKDEHGRWREWQEDEAEGGVEE